MRFGPFLAIALILIVVWICAFVLFHIASALIHLLLLFAVIAFIIHLVSTPKRA
ncbi:MAG: lmo0937 family membrane protein [Candidatus Acidiferrales bacterium]